MTCLITVNSCLYGDVKKLTWIKTSRKISFSCSAIDWQGCGYG